MLNMDMGRGMDDGIFNRLLRDIEVERHLESGNEMLIGQFLASVCSEDFNCPPISRLGQKLSADGLFLVIECIVAFRNGFITESQKKDCLERLDQLGLQLGKINDTVCEDYDGSTIQDLRDTISGQSTTIENLLSEIDNLEGELIRKQ